MVSGAPDWSRSFVPTVGAKMLPVYNYVTGTLTAGSSTSPTGIYTVGSGRIFTLRALVASVNGGGAMRIVLSVPGIGYAFTCHFERNLYIAPEVFELWKITAGNVLYFNLTNSSDEDVSYHVDINGYEESV
jgi:hypothetical protein